MAECEENANANRIYKAPLLHLWRYSLKAHRKRELGGVIVKSLMYPRNEFKTEPLRPLPILQDHITDSHFPVFVSP